MLLFCSPLTLAFRRLTLRSWKGVDRDHSYRMLRQGWRRLWYSWRPYTGSVPPSLVADLKNVEIPTQNEKSLHTPVMVKEVLQCLDIQPGQVVLDLTFGAGGHSKAILQSVPGVTVVAADRDPLAFQLAQHLAQEYPGQVKPVLGRFSELDKLLPSLDVDVALLDAGCSSMQMDLAERGFSLSKDGPLDMRMDGDRYPDMPCAADVVNALDQQALASVLAAYGEERHTRKIAAAIAQARSVYPISRTLQLASIVAGAFPASALYARRDRLQRPSHVATKTFQALRIFVNDELNELHAGLRVVQSMLRPKGRLCVLTFHSLEDRLTKRFLRGEDLAAPPRRSIRQRARALREAEVEEHDEEEEGEEEEKGRESAHWVIPQKKVMKPSEEEVQKNPRARSAKLRTAIRR
nr:probable methyltransferase-like protein 15 isoform X2 [Misgurnus anguillicaudatus]XP_055059778.1 probable methyltransferase-like protein 15 isoform X2 [Misgurnus anguillicaudatus]XP_055059784.1 probable methyltransferase-like protein 15 isoform X2 [Misgurnus anguillicaudatus]